jgi:hypothetical protein
MKLWRAIVQFFTEALQDLRIFSKDVGSEAYKKLVQSSAALIVLALTTLFLYFGGIEKIKQAFQDKVEREENYTTRQICGVITDELTGKPLPNVLVAIIGQTGDTVRSNGQGYFSLKFRAHKDSTNVNMALILNGYEQDSEKRRPIPLNPRASNATQTFTLRSNDPQ